MAPRRSGVDYRPGDWFAVPLADGTVAPARVVVRGKGHATLSYVFRPGRSTPTLDGVRALEPGDAVLAVVLSGLDIGTDWPLLGGREDFDASRWPLPEFETEVPYPDGARLRVDRRDRTLRVVEQVEVPLAEAGRRQPGGALGGGYLRQWLPLQLDAGALRPLREQVWWPADGRSGDAGGTVEAATAPAAGRSALLRVVLPPPVDPDLVERVEDALRAGLGDVGEVDGSMMGPDGGEVRVHAADPEAAVRRAEAVLDGLPLPGGTRVTVRPADDDADRGGSSPRGHRSP